VAASASRRPIIAATVFATWFGAETVLGIPATFMKEGLRGLVADPFAAVAACARGPRLRAPALSPRPLTLGDYFRARYGRPAEVVLTLCIAFSYFGWVAAQFVALGLAFNVLSAGAIDTRTGIVIGLRGGARLHDGGRHVVGGAHRPSPGRRDRGRHGLRRVDGGGPGGRRGARARDGRGRGSLRFLPRATCARCSRGSRRRS
jgi:hypothetical protein